MSTILLNFSVHTRNWTRIDLQLLKFNYEFFIFADFGGGGGGGEDVHFAEFQQSQNSRSLYQAENQFKITKIIQKKYFE